MMSTINLPLLEMKKWRVPDLKDLSESSSYIFLPTTKQEQTHIVMLGTQKPLRGG